MKLSKAELELMLKLIQARIYFLEQVQMSRKKKNWIATELTSLDNLEIYFTNKLYGKKE